LRAQYVQENALINKNTHKLLLNTKAKNANAAASSRMNLANVGGAAASMFGGKGGAAVGRGIGIGAMAGGATGLALGVGFAGSAVVGKMMQEFGDLQEAATDLKVFLGEDFGEEAANAFRKIARESSLTTAGLIKNARVWASYGLETENIVDIVHRLGVAAGGEAAAFDNLTRAFAQVNAAGKLMGQEKNQLINAGFSLKIIADEAGVSMTNFAKAMEQGLITAEHVNNALIKATDRGGLYFGRLEKKAQTLNGQMDLLANNFNDLFANLGESKSGFFSSVLNKINETLSHTSAVISQANELERTREKIRQNEEFGRSGSKTVAGGHVMTPSDRMGGYLEFERAFIDSYMSGTKGLGGLGDIIESLIGNRNILDTDFQAKAARAAEREKLMDREFFTRNQAVERGMLRPSDYSAAEDADKKRAKAEAKIEQEALNYLEERGKLQNQIASDEERQMMEMQEEFNEYAAKIRSTMGLLGNDGFLLQMKKQVMSADAERAIEEDKLDEEKRQANKLEQALDVAGPGQMRQNSIEEFIYLKTQRDNARKEKREEDKYQKDRQLKIELHTKTVKAINDLKPSQQQADANQVIPVN
jgi:tape measure domain-containing protein